MTDWCCRGAACAGRPGLLEHEQRNTPHFVYGGRDSSEEIRAADAADSTLAVQMSELWLEQVCLCGSDHGMSSDALRDVGDDGRLDLLIAGYEQQVNESLRYWRTRFVVIPTLEPPTYTGSLGEGIASLAGPARMPRPLP
jgi:hypothetical protein